jgi:hypothetical protein
MASRTVAKAEKALTRIEKVLAWLYATARRLREAVKASGPYQWLDTHVYDHPPVPYTTLIGYCLALIVSMGVLLGGSVLIVRKHDAAGVQVRIDTAKRNAAREVTRIEAETRDLINIQTMELARLSGELDTCHTTLTPLVPAIKPRAYRRPRTSPQKPAAPGYTGPRPW